MGQRGRAESCPFPDSSIYQAPAQYPPARGRDKEQNWPPNGEFIKTRQVKTRDDLLDLVQMLKVLSKSGKLTNRNARHHEGKLDSQYLRTLAPFMR
jgi:hypothetical protein